MSSNEVEHQGVRVRLEGRQASVEEQEIDLTPTEFRLLNCLIRHPGQTFNRAQLLDVAIGGGTIVLERTIDVHVKNLRRKLAAKGDLIETVRGVGYRFRAS